MILFSTRAARRKLLPMRNAIFSFVQYARRPEPPIAVMLATIGHLE